MFLFTMLVLFVSAVILSYDVMGVCVVMPPLLCLVAIGVVEPPMANLSISLAGVQQLTATDVAENSSGYSK